MTRSRRLDDGTTWTGPKHRLLIDADGGAYSSLSRSIQKTIGLLYESLATTMIFAASDWTARVRHRTRENLQAGRSSRSNTAREFAGERVSCCRNLLLLWWRLGPRDEGGGPFFFFFFPPGGHCQDGLSQTLRHGPTVAKPNVTAKRMGCGTSILSDGMTDSKDVREIARPGGTNSRGRSHRLPSLENPRPAAAATRRSRRAISTQRRAGGIMHVPGRASMYHRVVRDVAGYVSPDADCGKTTRNSSKWRCVNSFVAAMGPMRDSANGSHFAVSRKVAANTDGSPTSFSANVHLWSKSDDGNRRDMPPK